MVKFDAQFFEKQEIKAFIIAINNIAPARKKEVIESVIQFGCEILDSYPIIAIAAEEDVVRRLVVERQRLQRQRAGTHLAGAVRNIHPIGLTDGEGDRLAYREMQSSYAFSAAVPSPKPIGGIDAITAQNPNTRHAFPMAIASPSV